MKKLLLTVSCLSALTLSAQNGILKTIGGAAKNKVEQQDFNSTRTNKEKGNMLNDEKRSAPAPGSSMPSDSTTVEPADTTKKVVTPTPVMSPPMFGKAKYESTYTFGQKVTYQIENLSKSSDEPHAVTYYYSDGATMSAMEDKQMNVIMDFTNESTIMLNEKEQTATAMAMHPTMNKQPEKTGNEATVTKTGNTKQILGYNCDEYLIQSEKSKSLCWITTEIKLDYTKAMMGMAKNMGFASHTNAEDMGKGMMMEMTSYNKKGEAETHMIVTEYKEETVVKALSGYKVTTF